MTAAAGIGVTLQTIYVAQLAGELLRERSPRPATFFFCFVLYILPTFLVAIGAYAHAAKRQLWGRVVLIAATLFLTVWFFLSLVVLVWSGRVLLSFLGILFAILTSIFSLLVRRNDATGS